MSKRGKTSGGGAMLDLWRSPQGAGDPIGCVATTYTFSPGLFDEQCLGRFLEIESEPNREDLAFLLERESRLGSVYAAVLVDHTQAGVEHSLRWDVLPVRMQTGKQHAKLSLLAWSRHIRIIVASANLTDPGYRTNYEVATAVDLSPEQADHSMLTAAIGFLRSLVSLVPGALDSPPDVRRAEAFLAQIERQVRGWKPVRRGGAIRQQLVFTLPKVGMGQAAVSSLASVVQACRRRGDSPNEAWVASPFFDANASHLTASLCKLMARGRRRDLWFCVPAIPLNDPAAVPRLAAPKELLLTPPNFGASAAIEMLPDQDGDQNRRPWHAKMLALRADQYSALLIGSSNFTCAGMGVGEYRNAEANVLAIADRVSMSRDVGHLEAVWPEMVQVTDPEAAEWLGARADQEEEEQALNRPLPAGFLGASYRAGNQRAISLRLDPEHLPDDWRIHACGQDKRELLSASTWRESGRLPVIKVAWDPIQPPDKLLVCWADHEGFLPLNVEDSRELPPPAQLANMSSDDMLWILAAADPSAAYRAWARCQQPTDVFDSNLDSATPIDLDPLRRYDLQTTFLHRIRHRARILAQLRVNLQRPVWGKQALEWRLRGLIGIESLADRLVRDYANANDTVDEALLTLADFLIVLREVKYEPSDGSLSKVAFDTVFRLFLNELVIKLQPQVVAHTNRLSTDVMDFWERVVEQCRG